MASQGELEWAADYDGYARLAGTPASLYGLVQGAEAELFETGAVPSWCGVDLLRGWAFGLGRAEWPGRRLGVHWFALLDAISAHPEARFADVPPGRTD